MELMRRSSAAVDLVLDHSGSFAWSIRSDSSLARSRACLSADMDGTVRIRGDPISDSSGGSARGETETSEMETKNAKRSKLHGVVSISTSSGSIPKTPLVAQAAGL